MRVKLLSWLQWVWGRSPGIAPAILLPTPPRVLVWWSSVSLDVVLELQGRQVSPDMH